MENKLSPLKIGDLKINIPIFQGGMGVKVSTAALAIAVANYGGAGTISSVGLAGNNTQTAKTYIESSNKALQKEIRLAKESTDGAVGINIMVALSNYEEMVKTAAAENVDFIASGAGLPLRLPEFTRKSTAKLIPIVSSARSAEIIFKTWQRRYNRLPDAIIVEGPMAGGHLGFKAEGLAQNKTKSLEQLVTDVIKIAATYSSDIPIIAGGGMFDGKDIAKFLKLGAKGVQMGSRFVATYECPVSKKFKELYIAAQDKDLVIIKSPVGMPGRVIRTKFIDKIQNGEKIPFKCTYKCLKSCNIKAAPFCIAQALCNAEQGDMENAVVFAGCGVTKIKKIVSVAQMMDEVVAEAINELNKV